MPWSHTSPLDQKTPFIADDLRDRLAMTALCGLYGVSRKTGYTWVDRSRTHGPQGLEERSRRPSTSPRHTPDQVLAAILEARQRHPSWGAKQRVSILSARHPRWPWPARSPVCDIINWHGLVPKQRPRRAMGHPLIPFFIWPRSCHKVLSFKIFFRQPPRVAGVIALLHGKFRERSSADENALRSAELPTDPVLPGTNL